METTNVTAIVTGDILAMIYGNEPGRSEPRQIFRV
jgi:hypothetical protein